MDMDSPKPSRLNIKDLLRPHLKLLMLGLAAVIGEGVADLLQPWPLKVVLDNVLKSRDIHGWLNEFILSTVGQDKLAILRFATLAVLAIAVVDAICTYTEKYVTTSVGQWVMHDLRRTLYHHIQRLSLAYHDRKQTGDLISRVTNDIDCIQTFITSGLLGALVNCLTLFGMVGVMLYLNWRFTLIALSIAPVLFAVVYSYTRRIKKASREVRKKEGEMVSVMQEVPSCIRVVNAFAREEYEERRLEEESLESVEIAMRARSLKAKLSPLVGVIVAAGTALVLWFGAWVGVLGAAGTARVLWLGAGMALTGLLSAGSLVVFIMYLGKMYKPMQELSKMTDTYSKASIGYERIQEVLDTDGEIKDLPGARRAPRFKGEIEFEKVNFAYDSNRLVLQDVSLKVEPGQVAALVGPTGAGKSTIISLIPRFYDPTSGVVKVDGQDIRRYQQK